MTINFCTWNTPNGRKISVALGEMGLSYQVHPINIGKGAQFGEAFLKISPNNRIPAIMDPDGSGGAPISVKRWHEQMMARPAVQRGFARSCAVLNQGCSEERRARTESQRESGHPVHQ